MGIRVPLPNRPGRDIGQHGMLVAQGTSEKGQNQNGIYMHMHVFYISLWVQLFRV